MTDIEMKDILDTLYTHRRNLIGKAVEAAIKAKAKRTRKRLIIICEQGALMTLGR